MGAGHTRVSGSSEIVTLSRIALYQQWRNPLSFNSLVTILGAEIVKNEKDSNVNLSMSALERDSFLKIF